MHGSGSGLLDPGFEKILNLKEKGWICLFKGKSGSASFGTKNGTLLVEGKSEF